MKSSNKYSAERNAELQSSVSELLRGAGPAKIRAGDPEYVERAISYLEGDPYCDRSGYTKSYIVRYLKLVPFSDSQTERLRTLILRVIDTYGPYNGRHLSRLAASVSSPQFLDAIGVRLQSPDLDIRRRARYILAVVERVNRGAAGRWARKQGN